MNHDERIHLEHENENEYNDIFLSLFLGPNRDRGRNPCPCPSLGARTHHVHALFHGRIRVHVQYRNVSFSQHSKATNAPNANAIAKQRNAERESDDVCLKDETSRLCENENEASPGMKEKVEIDEDEDDEHGKTVVVVVEKTQKEGAEGVGEM